MSSRSRFSAEQLSAITGLSRRTIRYYVDKQLVAKPVGERKAAYYTDRHLADLLWVKEKVAAGYRLAGLRSIRSERGRPQASRGGQEIWTHISISPSIKLLIEPSSARIPARDLRAFIKGVMRVHQQVVLHEKGK